MIYKLKLFPYRAYWEARNLKSCEHIFVLHFASKMFCIPTFNQQYDYKDYAPFVPDNFITTLTIL